MTAPAFKAAGSIAVDVGSNVTVAWPTHVAGDYAILVSASFNGPPDNAPTLVTPAGFTLIGNVQGTAGNSTNLTLWWNYATSSAMASPVMPTQGLNAGGQGSSLGQIFTFSGAANSAPDVTSFTGGTGASLSASGATTTGANRLVAAFASQYGLTSGAISVTGWANASLASFAEQVDGSGAMNGFVNSGFNPSLQVLALATGSLASAGAYGATTGTFSGGWSSGGWSAATLALAPLAVTLTSITIAPSSGTVAPAGTLQLAATGHYSDSSTADVTATATWSTDNAPHATVSATGLVTGVAVGLANITATLSAISGSAAITCAGSTQPTLTPTFTMVAHSPPVSGTNNMLAQVSVGTGTFTTTSPPVAQQTASGLGIHPVPLPGNIALTDVVTNTGGTLAALQAGGGAFKWVVAIEGYPYLLTDANTAKAVIAWSGTDYTQALGGLFVELDNQQAINPHDPFANSGGTLTFRVQPDATDQFGIDTNRRAAGAEAKVIRTLDRTGACITIPTKRGNDVQLWPWIAVDNGLGFVAGDAWIGTECVSLNGPGQNNVSFSARGKYAPFASGGTGGARFAQHHRVAADANGVSTNPLLTQQPRTWVGRMVGLWWHKVDANGTLNAKTDAQCVFAGRIAAISDDAETGFTSVQCTHFLDGIKSTTIGRDLWSATVAEGVYIATGRTFSLSDGYSGAAGKTGNTLTVVASGATGTNQINAGWYTLGEICDFLNTWIGAETVATRVYGSYRWAAPVSSNVGFRTKCYWSIAGTANVLSLWALSMPSEVAQLLGLTQFADAQVIAGTVTAGASSTSATPTIYQSANPPMRETFTKQLGMGGFYFRIAVEAERGVLQDQYAFLPSNQKPPTSSGLVWGAFILNGKYILLGARDPSTSDTTLTNVVPLNLPLPGAQSTSDVLFTTLGRPADDTNAGPMTITQLFILDTTFAKLLKTLAYSTGTPGYNHSLYDTLSYGLGLGLPNDILGAPFERTIDRLPGAQLPICVTIDKPLTFQELLGADLLMRRAFPIWRNGHIEMSQWTTPTSDLALIALNEGNKAEPAASMSSQRSATVLTDEWMKNVVQIHYNRDITDVSKEDYQNSLTLEDQRSVDDSGGITAVLDIKARNTFVQLAGTGAGIEDLAPGYLALMPLFSQPVRKSTRSNDLRSYEGIAPGDQALVTDKFMRDPATGIRGVSSRAAIITRTRYNPGGPTAGNPDSVVGMQGEVDVFFLDLHRYGSYAPCADIDTTYQNAGFVNGYRASTLEIALLAHANSESADVADYTRFKNGDQVVIQQIDPDDPAVALSWSRRLTVAPAGNFITIDQALVGYDITKLYRVTYDTYARVQGLQQSSVFQAADATGRIQNVGYAYEWAATPELANTTANGVADAAELMPALAYGDGVPLDAGNERGLLRAINAMIDYKAARCSPAFFDQTSFSYLNAPNYLVVLVRRIYLGGEQLTNSVFRYLSVAPWTRVTSDGASGQLRVTLSRSSPERLGGTALGSSQIQFNDQYDQVIFDAGSSSTWWTPSRQLLSAAVKDSSGYAWITIERIGRAESRGLALCQLGPRVVSV